MTRFDDPVGVPTTETIGCAAAQAVGAPSGSWSHGEAAERETPLLARDVADGTAFHQAARDAASRPIGYAIAQRIVGRGAGEPRAEIPWPTPLAVARELLGHVRSLWPRASEPYDSAPRAVLMVMVTVYVPLFALAGIAWALAAWG